jgi:hypothetical protein
LGMIGYHLLLPGILKRPAKEAASHLFTLHGE